MDPLVIMSLIVLAAIPPAIIYAKISARRLDREFGRRDDK